MKIITPIGVIEKRIIAALQKDIEENGPPPKLYKKLDGLYLLIADILRNAILNSNEFRSIMGEAGGKLKADFGLTEDSYYILPSIAADLVEIDYSVDKSTESKTALSIRYTVRARPEDDPYVHSSILRTSYVSEKSNELIEWLRWLLFAGGDVINESYKVIYKDGKGRSGLAIMAQGNNFSFRVDGEFSGIHGSNLVSRSIEEAKGSIETTIRNY